MVLPGLSPVADLAAFYSAIEIFATTAGAKLPYTTNPNTEIAVGSLKLHVACSVANVPWSFVREFAQMLREMTAKGFTGFYDARLINIAAGVTVDVTLHVGQVAAAAGSEGKPTSFRCDASLGWQLVFMGNGVSHPAICTREAYRWKKPSGD